MQDDSITVKVKHANGVAEYDRSDFSKIRVTEMNKVRVFVDPMKDNTEITGISDYYGPTDDGLFFREFPNGEIIEVSIDEDDTGETIRL